MKPETDPLNETDVPTQSSSSLDEQANRTIMKYTMANMAVGVVPFPLIDIVALAGMQLKMLHSLAAIYDVEFKANLGKSAITSLIGGAGPVYAAAPVAASISKFIPFVGSALSYSSLVLLNGTSTYAIGKVFQQHFASGGTFLTFKPEAVRSYFAEQLEKGKTVIKSATQGKKSTVSTPTQSVDIDAEASAV